MPCACQPYLPASHICLTRGFVCMAPACTAAPMLVILFVCLFAYLLVPTCLPHPYHPFFTVLFTVYLNMAGCSDHLGMKSRLISDGQLSASSTFRTWGIDAFTWHPHYARLDKQGKTNAWSAASNNRSEWLQVSSVPLATPPLCAHATPTATLTCLAAGGPGDTEAVDRHHHPGSQRFRCGSVCDGLQGGVQQRWALLDCL